MTVLLLCQDIHPLPLSLWLRLQLCHRKAWGWIDNLKLSGVFFPVKIGKQGITFSASPQEECWC